MRPSAAIIVLAICAVTLAAMRLWALASVVALVGPAVVATRVVRNVRWLRPGRPVRLVDVSNAARARCADGRAVAAVQAAWMCEQTTLTAESVLRAVQLTRGDIAHAGAREARAVLDELEAEALAHPEGVPGSVVAAARMRFDQIMRANLQ